MTTDETKAEVARRLAALDRDFEEDMAEKAASLGRSMDDVATTAPKRATLWTRMDSKAAWRIEREDAPLVTIHSIYRDLRDRGFHATDLSITEVGKRPG